HLITAKMKVAVAQWDAVAVDQCGRVAEPLCRLGNDVAQHGKGIVGRGSKFSDGSLECAATREPGGAARGIMAGRRRTAAVLLLLALVASACGSRLNSAQHELAVNAALGRGGSSGGGAVAGDQTSTGDNTASGDTSGGGVGTGGTSGGTSGATSGGTSGGGGGGSTAGTTPAAPKGGN